VRSPFAHARITAVDAFGARSAPGVVVVFTGVDVRRSALVLDRRRRRPVQAVEPVIRPATIEMLSDGEVRYVGQAVAMVVATDRYLAEDAAELVRVDYEELPAVLDANGCRPAFGLMTTCPTTCRRYRVGSAIRRRLASAGEGRLHYRSQPADHGCAYGDARRACVDRRR
jgi:CO/xanthine dehydrogenase Mo-binding subunit